MHTDVHGPNGRGAERTPNTCPICGCSSRVPWLFVSTVAKNLGRPARTIRDWCERGWVDARRTGKLWQINHADLDRFLSRKEYDLNA